MKEPKIDFETNTYRVPDDIIPEVQIAKKMLRKCVEQRAEVDKTYNEACEEINKEANRVGNTLISLLCGVLNVPLDTATYAYSVDTNYLEHGVAFLVVVKPTTVDEEQVAPTTTVFPKPDKGKLN